MYICVYIGTTFVVYDAMHTVLREYMCPENNTLPLNSLPENYMLPLNSLTITSLCNIYLYIYRHNIYGV